ncbi:MAG: hypothetical protein H6Q03_2432, partial [Acidobacteria bacterium]|nr:hypothetical protein [Acidobacteriota bacterium]
MSALLEISGLVVTFPRPDGTAVPVVRGLSLAV